MTAQSFLSVLKAWIIPISLFFLFLAYFVFGTGWYEPTKLVLRGQTTTMGAPVLSVRWDSGQGFNEYEKRTIQILDSQVSSTIILGATGRKNPSACSTDIVCTGVFVDKKTIDLRSIAKGILYEAEALHFKSGETISFNVQAQSHVGLRFATSCLTAGTALISVNGSSSYHDLFLADEPTLSTQFDYWFLHPDGSFAVEIDLPRYPVHQIEIINNKNVNSVKLISAQVRGTEKVVELLHEYQFVQLGTVRFSNVLYSRMKKYFSPFQFCQQILFSLLSTWLIMTLVRLYKSIGDLRNCIFSNQRRWFFLMIGCSLIVFSAWLAAFWPGILSVDSLKIWRAANLPNVYSNEHPLLNIIQYKYFYHLWNNAAVVPIVHILLIVLLISWFGFWIFQQGVSIKIVLLWLIFVLSSVPVGVYNLLFWKDIPFAILIIFWSCLLAWLRQKKQQRRRIWTTQRIWALLLLGLSLGLVRHNGLVYYAVLPVLLLLLKLVPLKKSLSGMAVLLLVAGIVFGVLRNADKTANEGFLIQAVRAYASTVKLENVVQDVQRTARDYLTVLDINAPQADKFHYYLHDRQAWSFLLHSGWWDVYPYQQNNPAFPQLRNAAMQLYEWSYTKPWLWLMWNPVWLLALLPLLTMCFRWLPNTAILGTMLLSGALPLVYLQIFNWRYYYFLYFGLLFLPAFVLLDFQQWRTAELKQNT